MSKEILINLWGQEFFDECLHEAKALSPDPGGGARIELVLAVAIGKILKK